MLSATKDDVTDEEEDFDEGTPPPSDDSGDEVRCQAFGRESWLIG